MTGIMDPKTFRMNGNIKHQMISILVDLGSTHNFLQPNVAKLLRLPILAIQPFRVMVGNGEFLECTGCYKQVAITIQNINFHIDCFVLPIKGADLVLGVQWLKSLGPVTVDY